MQMNGCSKVVVHLLLETEYIQVYGGVKTAFSVYTNSLKVIYTYIIIKAEDYMPSGVGIGMDEDNRI